MTVPLDPLLDALRAALGPAYEIESELSGGGMSRVFVATERALNRRVVVKVLPPDLAAGVNRDRFRREIQLAAQLQHPHIVPLLSAGDTEGILYYTMPFIEGESLKHALSHGTRFSAREVLGILLDVVDALAYAHARGVIHRDVKPANVLRSGVHALVADFGVAKALSASLPAVGMTTSGMAIGTPQYMAPEQLAGDPAADHRVDVYAVGLLGYELLTGAPTFAEPSPQATLAAQLTRNPAPLHLKRPDAPDALSRLLMRCLAKDPAARPQTAQAVRAELDEIVMPSGDYTPSRLVGVRRSRLTVPIAVGAVLLVAAIALATQMGGGPATDADSTIVAPPPTPVVRADSTPAPPVVTQPSTSVVASPPAAKSDSPSGRAAPTTADGRRATAAGTGRRATAPTVRGPADSIAQLALFLKAQAPGDPIVRQPSPNAVSQAALEERRNNPGPRRNVLVSGGQDSVSQLVKARLMRQLQGERFQVSSGETSQDVSGAIDSLAAAAAQSGHDVFAYVQASLRRDSSYTAVIQLRDLTAHMSYANNAASRRVPRDSIPLGADSLAANAVRRLVQMDRAPRANAVDPEVRAFRERAADMGPPRRVVIWNHPPHDNLQVQEAGSVIMDALRSALRGSSRFVQVPRDSTLELLARSRNRETVLASLKADMMVSIASNFSSQAMDSVSWIITVRDVGATNQFQERSFRSTVAPLSSPFAFVAATLSRVLAAIEQMDTAPRRRASQ